MHDLLLTSLLIIGAILPGIHGNEGENIAATILHEDGTAGLAFTSATMPPSSASHPTVWKPAVDDTWQWQLSGDINTAYSAMIFDIDLMDTPPSTIGALHRRGKRVICYFSAGSAEDFRVDSGRFAASDMGKTLAGWSGERWLDIRSDNVREIMRDRLDLAVAKRCDGVEPDNVDGYANESGFSLSFEDQLDYNRFLASEARSRGLAVGLKNDLDQVPALVSSFDFAVNEQCHEFDECDKLAPFIENGKPVFNAEYERRYVENPAIRARVCDAANSLRIQTLILPLELDDRFRYSC